MATQTLKLGLTKPALTDLVDITKLNTNFDTIDTATSRAVTRVVATSDSSAAGKLAADHVVLADSTSAQTTINTAISALPATGGKIVLLDGTYIVGGSVLLPSNVTLEGQGYSTVLKIKDGLNTNLLGVIANAAGDTGNNNIIIRNLRINGNKANNSSGNQTGIRLSGVANCIIENCWVNNCRDSGITLRLNSINNIISKCFSGYNAQAGILVDNGSNNSIINNQCTFNGFYGICLQTSQGNIIKGNYCGYNTSYDGIIIIVGQGNIISENTCGYNGTDGISLQQSSVIFCSNNVVSNNVTFNNGGNGIILYSNQTNNGLQNNKVIGNCSYLNGRVGIKVQDGSNNSICNNYCAENSQVANLNSGNIHVQAFSATADYNNIQGNVCRRGSQANKPSFGIRIDSTACTGNLVTNNDLYLSGVTTSLSDNGTGTITTAGNRL